MAHGWIIEPVLPLWAWAVVAGVTAVAWGWHARRRPAVITRRRWGIIITLMALDLALVLSLLLNPQWDEPIPAPAGQAGLTVLVDASRSMSVTDPGQSTSRYAQAVRVAQDLTSQLGGSFPIRVFPFTDQVDHRPMTELPTLLPEGDETCLADSIINSLASLSPTGARLVVLSDGHDTASGIDQEMLLVLLRSSHPQGRGIPIDTLTLGSTTPPPQVTLTLLRPQEVIPAHQRAQARVRLMQHGFAGVTVQVQLWENDALLTEQPATFTSTAAPMDVSLLTPPLPVGVHTFTVRVVGPPDRLLLPLAAPPSAPGSLAAGNSIAPDTNNSLTALWQVRAIEHPLGVLLIEGQPHWDTKFLTQTLSRDPMLRVTSLVQLAHDRAILRTWSRHDDTATTTAPASPPVTEQWELWTQPPADLWAQAGLLDQQQIILLGRDLDDFLPPAAITTLRLWVAQDGGTLLFYRGAPSPQIAAALGVSSSSALLTTTPAVPPVTTTGDGADGADPAASALSVQPWGLGQIALTDTTGMWRRAFTTPPPPPDTPPDTTTDAGYTTYWQDLLRHLVMGDRLLAGQDLLLRPSALTTDTSAPVGVQLLLRPGRFPGGPPGIHLRGPDGVEQSAAPVAVAAELGVYAATFGKLPPGRYEAWVNGYEHDPAGRTMMQVQPTGEEWRDPTARPDLMAGIARETGGLVLGADPVTAISRSLQRQTLAAAQPRFHRVTLWDRPWVLVGVLACWALTWALRRSSGLV